MQYGDRRGLMVVQMEPEEGFQDTLNRWYDEEHLAERRQVPGVLSARRWVAVEGAPTYLAMYELENPDVVHGEAYLAQKRNPTPLTVEVEAHVTMARRIYVEITPPTAGGPRTGGAVAAPRPGSGLLFVLIDVDPEDDAELERWYTEEHLPERLACEGFLDARRFLLVEGDGPRYLATYELADPGVLERPAYQALFPPSGWTRRVEARFTARIRNVYREITPVPAGQEAGA